jgi:hypothetical protein
MIAFAFAFQAVVDQLHDQTFIPKLDDESSIGSALSRLGWFA